MECVRIEDVQKLFDELQSWDKAEFIKNNIEYGDPYDILEYTSFDDLIENDEPTMSYEERLDLIPIEVIKRYIDDYEKE